MITEIIYQITHTLYIILLPNLWIKYFSVPLIFAIIFLFLTKLKNHYNIFEKIVISSLYNVPPKKNQ